MERRQSKANRLQTTRMAGEMLDAYYGELKQAREKGKMVAWVNGPPAWVLLKAMDIIYLHGEAYGAANAARRIDEELRHAADEEGYSAETCSYSRITLGGGLFSERGIPPGLAHTEMIMPKPDFLFTVNRSCSTETNWLDAMARFFKVPSILVDMPYVFRESDMDRYVADVTRQLKEVISFIEKVTGRVYDWDRLKEMMAVLKEAAVLRVEGMKLCQNRPSPASFFDWSVSLGALNYLAGLPSAAEYFRKLKEELAARVASQTGAVANEKYRLMFDGLLCWPRVGRLAQKFAERDACVIAGRYTHYGFFDEPDRLDPGRPLESLADSLVRGAVNRSPEWQAKAVVDMCREYSLDGILIHAVRTCRAHQRPQHAIMDAVSRELGIPVTIFEGDHGDPNFISDAQADSAIDSLIDMIAARKHD